MCSVDEKFPWKKDKKLFDEAIELFEKRREYENWVIFRFGCELSDLDDIDLIFRGPNEYPDAILVKVDARTGKISKALDVEFEENSSSFKEHGHDPEKCDLIVCARDDWKEKFPNEKCPLPVHVVVGKTYTVAS